MRDTQTNKLATLNWRARNASLWNLPATSNSSTYPAFSTPSAVVQNPTFFTDYQDCKFLGHSKYYAYRPVMICSGVATLAINVTAGGLALVDLETMLPLYEVPLTMKSALRVPVTQYPFDVAWVEGSMRVYFLPDQRNSTVYVFEPVRMSPYEY